VEDITEFRETGDGKSTDERVDKRPCLVMIDGDYLGEVFALDKDVVMLGRSDDVDITITDPSMSRRHTMIVKRANAFFASDLDSTNGTRINNEKIQTSTELREGDKLRLGQISFKFTYQDEDDTEYHRQLRNMAVKDGLTRIHNRRYFTEMAEKEFDYARRYDADLSLILFDIDHFKKLNDTHGHAAGDYVLREMASTLEQTVREYDVFARYGGEEFVFLLRGSALETSVAIADRLRQIVSDCEFLYEEHNLHVTISVGVAAYSGGDEVTDHEQLTELADKMLYEAKHAGRNCTCFKVDDKVEVHH